MRHPTCRTRLWHAAALVCLAAAAACTLLPNPPTPVPIPETTAGSADYWPTEGWRTSTPEEQGLDAGKITQAVEMIRRKYPLFDSLLIIRRGYLVSETYFGAYKETDKHAMWSVTKSVASTLIGIAVDRGYIGGVGGKVIDFFPGTKIENPDPWKDQMTLEDVLTMRTGLDWPEDDPAFSALYRSRDWAQHMLGLPIAAAPGTAFRYCSGCSHLLTAIVGKTTGMSARKFADRYLFEPLGIDGSSWETDPQGTVIGGWGLNLTPRDMAKLGYLFRQEGAWDGMQIVSAAWVKAATRKHTGTDGDLGYGYQWWVDPARNAFYALGKYGQAIFVAPDLDLIVVTTAQLATGDPVFELIEDYIVPAVREA